MKNILTSLKKIDKIPKYYSYEYENSKNIIVETLFGPSLNNFLQDNDNVFDYILVTIIGKQISEILMKIHQHGIIHNDVKPNNICWGKFSFSNFTNRNEFFLIDFGYSRKIGTVVNDDNNLKNPNINDILHNEDRIENKYAGTAEFMAISLSEGYSPSRRTDMEELIYTFVFLIKKSLPWSKIKAKNHVEKCKKMAIIKKKYKSK
jgi:serine/threonine protein kinase